MEAGVAEARGGPKAGGGETGPEARDTSSSWKGADAEGGTSLPQLDGLEGFGYSGV